MTRDGGDSKEVTCLVREERAVVAVSILGMFGRFSRKDVCAVIASGAFVLCAGRGGFANAQERTEARQSGPGRAHIEEVLRGLNRGRGVGQVAISPDGKRLAWIEGGRGVGEIRVASPDDLSQ